jgi:hypothetical protein
MGDLPSWQNRQPDPNRWHYRKRTLWHIVMAVPVLFWFIGLWISIKAEEIWDAVSVNLVTEDPRDWPSGHM